MKIGVITSAYPEFKGDPHGIFVHRLMREISKQGHEVHILAPYTWRKNRLHFRWGECGKIQLFLS